uniref:Uncharacterized protein n=1 Tax=Brassica oleracea TaxID=3712 RepID=A0A3P6GD35_BRAOL|nr:unnamed protein product [Brassica oleracea]
MWNINKEDLAMKERLSKMKLLDSLIAKQEPLAEYEVALKKKLITELLKRTERVVKLVSRTYFCSHGPEACVTD